MQVSKVYVKQINRVAFLSYDIAIIPDSRISLMRIIYNSPRNSPLIFNYSLITLIQFT